MSALHLVLAHATKMDPFVAVLVLVVIVGTILILRNNAKVRFEAFCAAIARRLNGTFEPGGFLQNPRICFRIDGRPAYVEFVDGKYPRTHLRVAFLKPFPGSLRIVPASLGRSLLRLLGARYASVGDERFDQEFAIQSTPESLAARLFTPVRRPSAMAAVRRLSMFVGPSLKVGTEGLEIQVEQKADQESQLLSLVRTATEIVGYLFPLDPDEGIQWMEFTTTADIACPICGSRIAGPVTFCPKCRTPHHEECWTYAGRCSRYGCGGRRSAA